MADPVADPFTGVLIGFARELRAAGLTVGTGDVLTYFAAMTPLDPTDLVDLYWAGRATLVSRHEDEPVYDRVFRRYFLDEDGPARGELTFSAESVAEAEAALVMPGTEPGPEEEQERPVLGWMASDVDALKHRSFTACTPDELAALRRIMTRMRLTPPRRRTRRTRPAPGRGTEPDLRATIRESMRMHGEPPGRLFFRQRKTKLRPLILILDVSGSMADYSRHLLQFAHTARHAAARAGGGVLLRHQADPHHQGAGPPAGRRGAGRGGADGGRLGRRHPDRPVARHLRPAVGPARPVPGRGGGHLLRRARPGRSRGPRAGDGAAGAAVPPHRVAEPAQGRQPGFPAEHAGHDGGGAAHRPAAVRARPRQPGRAGRERCRR